MNIIKYIIELITRKNYLKNVLVDENTSRFINKVTDMSEYDPRKIFIYGSAIHTSSLLDGIYFSKHNNMIKRSLGKITKEKGLEIFKIMMGFDFIRFTEVAEYNKILGDSSIEPANYEKDVLNIIEYDKNNIKNMRRMRKAYIHAKKSEKHIPFYNEIYKIILETIYDKERPDISLDDLLSFARYLSDSSVKFHKYIAEMIKKNIYEEVDVNIDRIACGKYFYLLNYDEQYSFMLEGQESANRMHILKELYYFRSWITQFTLRLPFLNTDKEDKIIENMIGHATTLGKGTFSATHDNIEIGKEMLYKRWEDYDTLIEGGKHSPVPLEAICAKLLTNCNILLDADKQEMLIKDTEDLISEIRKDENYIILTSGL